MLGTYLYFKYFSVHGETKEESQTMLNNSDINTRNSKLYISKVAAYRIWYIVLYNGQLYKKN
jgi:hypothetical protein